MKLLILIILISIIYAESIIIDVNNGTTVKPIVGDRVVEYYDGDDLILRCHIDVNVYIKLYGYCDNLRHDQMTSMIFFSILLSIVSSTLSTVITVTLLHTIMFW